MINKMTNLFQTSRNIMLFAFFAYIPLSLLSIRKILYSVPIQGVFNEYSSVFLYASDILFFIWASFWGINILCNTSTSLSSAITPSCLGNKASAANQIKTISLLNVPRGTFINIASISKKLLPLHFIVGLLLIYSLSVLWSPDHWLAIHRTFRIFEFLCLAVFIRKEIVPRRTILLTLFGVITTIGLINSIIGIFQFIYKSSLGFSWIRESIVSSTTYGSAKIEFGTHQFLRAYGLFPHPNIMGGFLLFSIVLSFWLYNKLFHVEQKINTTQKNCSTWNNKFSYIHKYLEYDKLLIASILIQTTGIFLTFSKSALIGIALLSLFILIRTIRTKCSTWNIIAKLFITRGTYSGLKLALLSIAIIIVYALFIHQGSIARFVIDNVRKSSQDRIVYLNESIPIIKGNPFKGLGAGNYILGLSNTENRPDWSIQPVHNIFLLAWLEIGLLGPSFLIGLLFILFLRYCSTWNKNLTTSNSIVPRGTKYSLFYKTGALIIILLLPSMLLDHYLWSIHQGIVIFALVIGLSVSIDK